MKKIDVGQTIQILANVGVIASIIFLGIEIQQTNRAVTGAAYQARALAIMERQDMLAESTHLAPIIFKVEREGWNTLSDAEQARLNETALGALFRVDGMFYQYEIGLLDDDYYQTVFDAEMRLWVPRWRDQGILAEQEKRGFIRPSFAREIDKYMHLPPVFPIGEVDPQRE